MRCRSVACIWSDSPPVHKVTAVTVLNHPPTLYTGGSDGSIIWWNLPTSTLPNQEVKPVAMLCGHAAAIADLGICLPSAVSVDGKPDDFSVSSSSYMNSCGALISACKDGMLCVWSRASGYCRRRRQLPPWAGSPSIVRPLPENRRYVCVTCSSTSDHQSLDGQDRLLVDGEMHNWKSSKCTIVIVDSYTLSIVQTVFHGNLSIGPLKCMTIALSNGDTENMSIMLIDSFSRVQLLPISKDSDKTGANGTDMRQSTSHLEIKDWSDVSGFRELLVGCTCRGHVLVFMYATYCTFRLVDNGDKIGEIVFLDDHLCQGGSRIIGGLFLGEDNIGMEQKSGELEYSFSVEFAVWNNRSSANIYRTSYLRNVFKFELLFSVPAVPLPPDVVLSAYFVNACNYLLSVHSAGFHVGQSVIWKPHITAWLLPQQPDKEDSMTRECKLFSIGSFPDDWRLNSSRVGYFGSNFVLGTIHQQHMSNNGENPSGSDNKYLCSPKDNLVSSSMVISENCYAPSAIVYGYYNGTIEVVRFDMYFEELSSHDGNSPETSPSKLCLSGHTGAILCLAAHRMVRISRKWNFSHVLVSGGMDCTVRIWDLDSGKPIIVMHQHVGPVRQILLPPPKTDCPWIDCFLSVSEDSCVALTSLETLRVERMFPGHPYYPAKVAWDSVRGYAACLCLNHSGTLDTLDILYIWDVKTGARERVIRGSAAHSMFDHFCTGVKNDSSSFSLMHKNTSASSLTLPITEDPKNSESYLNHPVKGTSSKSNLVSRSLTDSSTSQPTGSKGMTTELFFQSNKPIVAVSCPFPGIAMLCFDLKSIISLCQSHSLFKAGSFDGNNTHSEAKTKETPKSYTQKRDDISQKGQVPEILSPRQVIKEENSDFNGIPAGTIADSEWVLLLETYLLQFSLSLLHLWNVDYELDELLVTEMKLKRPEIFNVASGLIGDRGSLTLSFPGSYATLELWKSSSEYCATRSLTMVSLAQHMLSLSHSCSASSSALAAFYTRNFIEKVPDVKPPLLQLLVSFWQDELEHVKMGARSLFHCAASRAIPRPLRTMAQAIYCGDLNGVAEQEDNPMNKIVPNSVGFDRKPEVEVDSQTEESEIISWLDSFEMQDWISCVGGTSQDAMTSHVIVAAALAVWYPSLVKASLPALIVQPLVKLVMSMNEKYSSTAAEILAEGMESTWKQYIASDLPHLIGDIFFQIECVSGASAKDAPQNSAASIHIKETLVGILLPSLAIADIPGFLSVIESQIWSTASDSLVHVVSLMTLNRVVRGSPRKLVQYLDKVVSFILQTMDPSNAVMRRTCIQSATATLKELSRVFPMVTLNDTSTRLAFGDAISEIKSSWIRIYDMQSMGKIKVLDASGPPGLPSLIGGTSEMAVTTAISALCFSTDGEGLVAFSENGLMIRWWSLGSVWWEKISRNLTPVQCTKVIFVSPWEGFSPSCTRSSIMASALSDDGRFNLQDERRASGEIDRLKLLIHNLDLSYHLEWVADRKVKLTQHGHELGVFQL